jgi:hypothetical protein
MSTEELVNTPLSDWDELCTGLHSDDLRLTANRLRELAIRTVRMAAYIDARGGEGVDMDTKRESRHRTT